MHLIKEELEIGLKSRHSSMGCGFSQRGLCYYDKHLLFVVFVMCVSLIMCCLYKDQFYVCFFKFRMGNVESEKL